MSLQPLLLALTFATAPTPPSADSPLPDPLATHASSYASFASAMPVALQSESHGGSYLRLSGGFVTTTDSDGPDEDLGFDEGWLAGLAFGQRMTSGGEPLNFSLELEGLYTHQDADNQGTIQALDDIAVLGVLINGLLDFRFTDQLALYAGAGAGVAWMDVKTNDDAAHDFEDEDGPFLAWQARAGLEWRTSSNMAINIGYRFLNIDDNQIDDGIGSSSFDLQTEQHTAEIGLRFGM
jgi:opacity protein-like surface antigen